MKQYFTHYKKWEDFQNGMYSMDCKNKRDKLYKSVDLLLSEELFYNNGILLFKKWPTASKVNITNLSQNRRAWLGAAACCFYCGSPEFITRLAWRLLEKEEQDLANLVAERLIDYYINNNIKNAQTLFN